MTSPALASRSVSPGVIDATIDRYIAASCARIDRLLVHAQLVEPVIKDAERAVKAMAPLIEALTGLAIGRVIGAVMQGVRRTFETKVGGRVEAAMRKALGTVAPPEVSPLFALDGSPCRAFGGEMRGRMRGRVALAPRDLRAVIGAMAAALEASEVTAFVRMLAVLTSDPMLGDRFAPQIEIAWRCYVAVAEGTACAPADVTWEQWLRKVRGAPDVAPTPTREKLAAAGVVVQIG